MQIVWRVDDGGGYVPNGTCPSTRRPARTGCSSPANRYALASDPFRVLPATALHPVVERGRVVLLYPPSDLDLPAARRAPRRGDVRVAAMFQVGERRVRGAGLDRRPSRPARAVLDGEAHDAYGNTSAQEMRLP